MTPFRQSETTASGRLFQKGRAKTGGRKRGVRNKFTRDVKEAVLNALERLGGEEWLIKLARLEPKAFASLLGKTMPLQVTASKAANDPGESARQIREQPCQMDAVTGPAPEYK